METHNIHSSTVTLDSPSSAMPYVFRRTPSIRTTFFLFLLHAVVPVVTGYANVTLTWGNVEATVFLPYGIRPTEDTYYMGTRFEHGSMIGPIKRKVTQAVERDGQVGELVEKVHTLFGTDLWRLPHNSDWPESAVGLASEFGVGDDGDFCFYRCGWPLEEGVTNGVLGYQTANSGESFLKIGVGELVKGSCPHCDSGEVYKFNSPYRFAQPPIWTLEMQSNNALRLEHSAKLKTYGYKIQKEVVLENDVLMVTTTLTNLGQEPFITAWYSHNFFTCDGVSVGPGYSVDLNLKGNQSPPYAEPGTWSWATPLRDFASVEPHPESIHVKITKSVPPGVRVKAEFMPDGQTTGDFTLNGCRHVVRSSLIGNMGNLEMYAYNFYVEQGTLSPEPQILLHLAPGAAQSWTQRLEFDDQPLEKSPMPADPLGLNAAALVTAPSTADVRFWMDAAKRGLLLCVVASVASAAFMRSGRYRGSAQTSSYESIPEASISV